MINYGYFRHRFDAHTNEKLNKFVDDVGLVGFAYYYLLLELYGAYINSNDDKTNAKIHQRVLANTWRKRVDSAHLVITKLQLSDLLVYTLCDSTYTISIPNFLKYYGSYKKTSTQKVLKENKIKENKIKENNISTNSAIFSCVIDYLNSVLKTQYKQTSKKTQSLIQARLNEGFTQNDFFLVVEKKNKDWSGDNKMHKYLRPETLFGNKFESYLQEALMEKNNNDNLIKSLGGIL